MSRTRALENICPGSYRPRMKLVAVAGYTNTEAIVIFLLFAAFYVGSKMYDAQKQKTVDKAFRAGMEAANPALVPESDYYRGSRTTRGQ